MGNNYVISSTDVCAVTLRYMRVLLIDLQINVCVRRSATKMFIGDILRTKHQRVYPIR